MSSAGLDKLLAFYQHTNNHHPKFWQWFAVVCGGLRWFAVVCGGLRWFAVVCGGLPAFHCFQDLSSQILVVICGGLR